MSPIKEEIHCDDDVPILIVGAGPCGLLLAYLLAQLGGTGPLLDNIGNWSREKESPVLDRIADCLIL